MFNKCFAIQKAADLKIDLPDSFAYNDYVFILKAVIANVDEEHYYCFIRNGFASNFYLINDSTIKVASKEQVDGAPNVLGLYYAFKHQLSTTEETTKAKIITMLLTIKDDIRKILDEINDYPKNVNMKKQEIAQTIEPISIDKKFKDIMPRVK